MSGARSATRTIGARSRGGRAARRRPASSCRGARRGFWSRSRPSSMPRPCWAIPSGRSTRRRGRGSSGSLRAALRREPVSRLVGPARILEPRFRALARRRSIRGPTARPWSRRRSRHLPDRGGGAARPRFRHRHRLPAAGAPVGAAARHRRRHRHRCPARPRARAGTPPLWAWNRGPFSLSAIGGRRSAAGSTRFSPTRPISRPGDRGSGAGGGAVRAAGWRSTAARDGLAGLSRAGARAAAAVGSRTASPASRSAPARRTDAAAIFRAGRA